MDPASRGNKLQYNPVTTQSTFQPGSFEKTDMSQFTPQDAGGAAGVFNQRAAKGSGGQRLAHDIQAQSVLANAMAAFQSQMPQLNIEFADQSDQLAKKTAAMGRTGSALFNRDTGYISDRGRAKRESLLGNLSFQGAQADQGADLQAQISSGQLKESQEGRMSQASMANAQMKNQMAMAQAQNALSAMMQNQRLGANMSQFNSQYDLANQQFNIGNQIGQNQFGAQFDVGQQGRMDQLANQAQQDLYNQMMLFGQGFQGDPTAAWQGAAGGIGQQGQEYGANAGMANQQIGQGANAMWQMLMGGGQQGMTQPYVQPQQQAPQYQPTQWAPPPNIFQGQFPGGQGAGFNDFLNFDPSNFQMQ